MPLFAQNPRQNPNPPLNPGGGGATRNPPRGVGVKGGGFKPTLTPFRGEKFSKKVNNPRWGVSFGENPPPN